MAEENSQGMTGYPILTFLIVFAGALSFLSPEIASVFIYDREAVLKGEAWRLFSSHFVHFSNTHLAYNLLAFGVAGWIAERRSHLHFALLHACMAMLISSSLFILKPAMSYYGGLSGLACGFLFHSALLGAGEPGPWRTMSKLIILFLPLKIVLEVFFNDLILPYPEQRRFVAMPVSHAMGIAGAFVFYVTMKLLNRNRTTGIQGKELVMGKDGVAR